MSGLITEHPDLDNPAPVPEENDGRKVVLWKKKPKPAPLPPPEDDMPAEEGAPLGDPLLDDPEAVRNAFASSVPSGQPTYRRAGTSMYDEAAEPIVPEIPGNAGFPVDTEIPPEGMLLPQLSAKNAKTLLDWRTIFPDVVARDGGDSPYTLRVERVEPKHFQGERIGGFIGDYQWMTDADFAARFGGGKYKVSLEGPDPKGVFDPLRGEQRRRRLGDMTLEFPGIPASQTRPNTMTQQQHAPEALSATITAKLMDRAFQQADKQEAPNQTVNLLLRQAEEASRQAQAAILERAREDRLRAEEAERQLRSGGPQADIVKALLERGRGTEDVERVRREYEDRIERVRAEAITDRQRTENALNERIRVLEDTLARRDDSFRVEMERREATMRDQLARELRDARESFERRERDMRETMDRREKDRQEAHDRAIAMERESRKNEVDALRRDNERAMASMKDDKERTVESMRRDQERDQAMLREMQKTALETKGSELDRLRSEIAQLRVENLDLKGKVFKDAVTQIQEAQALARITGMVSGEEASEGSKESFAESIGKTLAEKAPQLLQVLSPILQKYAGVVSSGGGGQAVPLGLPPGPQAPPPAGPPPQDQRRVIRNGAPPQQRRVVGGGPASIPIPQEGDLPVAFTPMHIPGEPPPYQPMEELKVQPPPPPQAPPPQQPPAPAPEAQAQPQSQETGLPPDVDLEYLGEVRQKFIATLRGPQPASFTEQTIGIFAQQATGAYQHGVPAVEFARSFHQMAGEMALAGLTWTTAEGASHLLEMATLGKEGWSLAGPRAWIEQVWKELETIRSAGGAA